ncbi:MAG: HNH endonuclease [Bacteroidales bacterium]
MRIKDIPGYPNYFVTSDGDVYSKEYNRQKFCKKLKQGINNAGYLHVTLWGEEKRKRIFVHILVANAFVPNPRRLKQPNHINSIRTDNHASNLEWMTQSENILYAYEQGRIIPTQGERHGNHLLTEEQVLRIREMWIPRIFSQEKIAALFGVKRGAIKDIVERKTWRHI